MLRDSFPDCYPDTLLKERFFHGMINGLKNGVRFLYKDDMVTYEDLLESTKEVESEFLETKVGARVKGVSLPDPSEKKLNDLEAQIKNLTLAIKAGNLASKKPGVASQKAWNSAPSTPTKSKNIESDERPPKGQFVDDRQCHKCRGWGHIRPTCPSRLLNSNRGREEGQVLCNAVYINL